MRGAPLHRRQLPPARSPPWVQNDRLAKHKSHAVSELKQWLRTPMAGVLRLQAWGAEVPSWNVRLQLRACKAGLVSPTYSSGGQWFHQTQSVNRYVNDI